MPTRATARFNSAVVGGLPGVRLHADSDVPTGMGARALTVGRHVAFAPDQFRPGTRQGDALIHHELAHVVQQAGGHGDVQASGLSYDGYEAEADAAAEAVHCGVPVSLTPLRGSVQPATVQLNDQDTPEPAPAGAEQPIMAPPEDMPFERPEQDPADGPLPSTLELSPEERAAIQAWLANTSPSATPSASGVSHPMFPGWSPGEELTAQFPSFPERGSSLEEQCPSCHSVVTAHRRQAKERAAAAQRRRRLEQWPRLHAQQHGLALSQQGTTLTEDITRSELQSSQLRLQLFQMAIGGTGSGTGHLTAELRDAWAGAQRAALLIEGLLNDQQEIPPDLVEPIRASFVTFFQRLVAGVREKDVIDERMRRLRQEQANTPCPSCHRPNPSGFGPLRFAGFPELMPSTGNDAYAQFLRSISAPTAPTVVATSSWETDFVGSRQAALQQWETAAQASSSAEQWRTTIANFRSATREMDALLLASTPVRMCDASALREQFEYAQGLLDRQRRLLAGYANALKVPAVFYPKPQGVDELERTENAEGVMENAARGLPWMFYLTHTPVEAGSTAFPEEFEWELHDLTAPRADGRTVKVRYRPSFIEKAVLELQSPMPVAEQDPPQALFDKLDHNDFFPEGHLYFTFPHSGRRGEVVTNADLSFWDWIRGIGIAIAVIGSLVFAPFSTPAVIAMGFGTGLALAGAAGRLMEKDEHGVLTNVDVNAFVWDVSMDILNALTMGMGRVATTAARSGNLGRAATAGRYWFYLQRAELAANITNVGVLAAGIATQYHAIQNSNMTSEQRERAMRDLTIGVLASGALAIVPVYSGLRDLRAGSTIHLGLDDQNRVIANVDGPDARRSAELDAGAGGRAADGPRSRVAQTRLAGSDHRMQYRDGAIHLCTDCGELSDRLARMEAIVPPDHPAQEALQALRADVVLAQQRFQAGAIDQATMDAHVESFMTRLGDLGATSPGVAHLATMNPAALRDLEIRLSLQGTGEAAAEVAEILSAPHVHSRPVRRPPGAQPPPRNPTTEQREAWVVQRLRQHVDMAIERFEREGYSPGQELLQRTDPRAAARHRGSRIDQFAKDSIMDDPDLAAVLTASDRFPEPDVIDTALRRPGDDWFDITTARSWAAHLRTYGRRYGRGGGLLHTGSQAGPPSPTQATNL